MKKMEICFEKKWFWGEMKNFILFILFEEKRWIYFFQKKVGKMKFSSFFSSKQFEKWKCSFFFFKKGEKMKIFLSFLQKKMKKWKTWFFFSKNEKCWRQKWKFSYFLQKKSEKRHWSLPNRCVRDWVQRVDTGSLPVSSQLWWRLEISRSAGRIVRPDEQIVAIKYRIQTWTSIQQTDIKLINTGSKMSL